MNSTLDQKCDFTSCELPNFLSKKNVGHCSSQYPNELKEGEERMMRLRERDRERE